MLLDSFGGKKGVRVTHDRDALTLPVKLKARPVVIEGIPSDSGKHFKGVLCKHLTTAERTNDRSTQ